MRRWLGQISGGEKRNEAGDEDIDREMKKRKLNAKWLTGREWLVFDHENVVMFCQDCRKKSKRAISCVMKQVKSDWRSRLKGETLSDLLKTQLCSPDIKDFDPTKAIDIWHADSLRSGRPDFVHKHGTKGTEGGSDSDGTSEEEEM
ncbi:hypothetical protein DPX16_14624 [Anabarilius grahami]|uniref:Uncharacterized protein n=1 Tax=Anabarilius grahami TaxID=495550 RepID=A0A3N0YYQ1_ANAGA|nr:hypothetical protein DPX16_14624 [Anabarilius grahami]